MTATDASSHTTTWSVAAIANACVATAVAVWLLPASVQIVTWSAAGPERVALFARLVDLWVALAGALVVAGVLLFAGANAHRACAVRARIAAPLALLWFWVLPYLPWLPDRAPGLLILAGPIRWLVAIGAVGGVALEWWQSRAPKAIRLHVPRRRTVFFVTLALYVVFGLRSLATIGLSGDEPHYLVITHSLLVDRDLRIENNHARGDYRSFFAGDLRPDFLVRGTNGEIYSIHSPGLSVLLLPGYAIAGARGAVFTMCVLAALAALAVYELAWLLYGPSSALLTWLSVCLTVPFVPHAWMLYPETACAAVVGWAVLWLAEPPPERRWVWAARGACLALLPWLHTKFVVLLMAMGAFLVWRLRARPKTLLAFGIPIVALSAGWLGYFYAIYGSIDPQVAYGSYTEQFVRFENLPRSLLGTLFDQKFGLLVYSPVYAVAAAGLWLMLRDPKRRALAFALAVTAIPYVISSSRLYMWWGGSSAPSRFLVPILPLLAPLLAIAFLKLSGRVQRATMTMCVALGLIVAAVGVAVPNQKLLFSDPHGIARFLDTMQGSAPVAAVLPTFTEVDWPAPVALAAQLGAAATMSLAVAFLAASRIRRLSAFWIGAIEAGVFLVATSALGAHVAAAARSETVLRARVALMHTYDPERLRGFAYETLVKLDPAALLRAMSLNVQRAFEEPVDERGRVAGPLTIPPGNYQLHAWFYGNLPQSGDLQLSLRHGNALVRASGPLANPTVIAFDVPIEIPLWITLTEQSAAHAVRSLEITPVAIVPASRRPDIEDAAVDAIPGRPNAYLVYVDADTYPEGGIFWTRAGTRGAVLLAPAGAARAVLTLHVGPIRGTVHVAVGDQVLDAEMQPNETRRISVAVPPNMSLVPISVQAPGWFRPADVDPASTDVRELGCQVRVELE